MVALGWRRVVTFLAGDVSQSTLLTRLLPLSLAAFGISLFIGVLLFQESYDFRTRVISRVISPRHNPEGYWIPSIGLAVAAIMALPFAGYVSVRLRAIAPRLAWGARATFTLGLLLNLAIVIPQYTEPMPGWRGLHSTVASASAGATALGVVFCWLSALRDAFARFGGRQALSRKLTVCWGAIVLLPLVLGIVTGGLLLGRTAGLRWAIEASAVLRPTMLWQLAFWEWVGVTLLFSFLFLSVLWLPKEAHPAVGTPKG